MFAPGHLGELTRVVPFEMVDAVLAEHGGLQSRVRRLPSRVVVYLLLAGAFFASQGWRQVFTRLAGAPPASEPAPASSSLTAAMRRVGPAPLRGLFDLLKGPGATGARQAARFAGSLVVAIDGTTMSIPDSETNLRAFPRANARPGGSPGYPRVRLVAVVAAGTRSIIDAVFGTDTVGELTYAARLTGALGRGMLLLADRNFATYRFFTQVAAREADFLIRAKTGTGAMKLPVLARLPDGSFLTRAAQVPVRVIDAAVTITTTTGTRTGTYRLITTLTDPATAPASALVRLYHERWEIETAYCELKSTILGGRVLRGRHPYAVTQEIWALLAAYQALRTAMTDAVLHRPDIDPDRASFTIALHAARDQITRTQDITTTETIDLIGTIGARILADLLPPRRTRTRARIVKRAISKYNARGNNIDRRTYQASITTAILTPDPDG